MKTYTLILYRPYYERHRHCEEYDRYDAFFEKSDGLTLEKVAERIAEFKMDPATLTSYNEEEIHFFEEVKVPDEDEYDRDSRLENERKAIMATADVHAERISIERSRAEEVARQKQKICEAEQAAKSAAATEAAERATLAKLQAKYRQ